MRPRNRAVTDRWKSLFGVRCEVLTGNEGNHEEYCLLGREYLQLLEIRNVLLSSSRPKIKLKNKADIAFQG
jgi:hypothetical protein